MLEKISPELVVVVLTEHLFENLYIFHYFKVFHVSDLINNKFKKFNKFNKFFFSNNGSVAGRRIKAEKK